VAPVINQIQFLVQSDFITSASRETIIDCEWNDAILDGVARTFAVAVDIFKRKGHRLCYSWLDYLPQIPTDHIWKNLYRKILDQLRLKDILQVRGTDTLKAPSSLRLLPSWSQYQGEPLLSEIRPKKYLASEYSTDHHSRLLDLGVSWLSYNEFIAVVERDLTKDDSRIKNFAQPDEWHSACSAAILRCSEAPPHEIKSDRLQKLKLIPIISNHGTEWVAICNMKGVSNDYFFPATGNIDIPTTLSLNLVDPRAVRLSEREALFCKLGVHHCPSEKVCEMILERHSSSSQFKENSLKDFKYLYYFYKNPEALLGKLLVPTEQGLSFPSKKVKYLLSDDEYSTQQCLKQGCESEIGYPHRFLSRELMDLIKPDEYGDRKSWNDWLKVVTGAQIDPFLRNSIVKDPKLAPVILDIAKERPEKFLGLLKKKMGNLVRKVPKFRAESINSAREMQSTDRKWSQCRTCFNLSASP
jgi:hypothetical protein